MSRFDSLQPLQNPPVWPTQIDEDGNSIPTVLVFDEQSEGIEAIVNQYTSVLQTKQGHFSSKRFAIMFKPGTYSVDVHVGYYVHVMGLGKSFKDVTFTSSSDVKKSGVYALAADPHGAGSCDTFWRAAENFTHDGHLPDPNRRPVDSDALNYNQSSKGMLWAVSQAAPIRRIHVQGNLQLFDVTGNNQASGGYSSNILTDGILECGSQQQWFTRNSEYKSGVSFHVWNFVAVGVKAPAFVKPFNSANFQLTRDISSANPLTNSLNTIPVTSFVADKPFISFNAVDEKFKLQVPKPTQGTSGTDYSEDNLIEYDFSLVYVASPTSTDIQDKIDAGYHIVFSPGIYALNAALIVKHDDQVLLGIGLATLQSSDVGCIKVNTGLHGVHIVGLTLQASKSTTGIRARYLLEWGAEGENNDGWPQNPGTLSDIYCRVGGPENTDRFDVSVETMIIIHSSFVIGDNLWLWRADHSALAENEIVSPGTSYHLVAKALDGRDSALKFEYPCDTALRVYGSNVVMYGLAAEHTLQDLIVWDGENGFVYFYQSELPYDVTTADFENYVGYRVGSNVSTHTAFGVGVYSCFRDHETIATTAICIPDKPGVNIINPYTVHLNYHGGIKSVMTKQNIETGFATVLGQAVDSSFKYGTIY